MKKPEHWYKRDPDAALEGMHNLSLEERGAYNTILDLIYSRTNRLPDDDRFISGWLGVDLRIWRRLRARLVGDSVDDGKKLYVKDGFIRNKRADIVIASWLDKAYQCSQAAGIKWDKSPKESLNNNTITDANAMPRARIEIEKEIERENNTLTSSYNKHPLTPSKGAAKAAGVVLEVVWKGIDACLSDAHREAAKRAAPGWDMYHLMNVYDQGVATRGIPRIPAAAFIAWCANYTKGKSPS